MLELVSCPECGVPAEITDRFPLSSTDGPVDHVVVQCAAGHFFRMAADMLAPQSQRLMPRSQPRSVQRPAVDAPRADRKPSRA